jgi:hypothetical protein
MEGDDEEDTLSFLTLAAVTANVVRYLLDKKEVDGETEDKRRAEDERSKQESRKLPIIGG